MTPTERNYKNQVLDCLDAVPASGIVVDCGCGDGSLTREIADRLRQPWIVGLEADDASAVSAKAKGLKIIKADLGRPLPFASESLSALITCQVFEHLLAPDAFLAETFRVLKPGGYTVMSTINAATWPSIVSLLFGWQPFSYSNTTAKKKYIGNPLAKYLLPDEPATSWQCHVRPYTTRALKELLELHGFHVERTYASGGFRPLPAFLERVLSTLDPWHALYVCLRGRKPASGTTLHTAS